MPTGVILASLPLVVVCDVFTHRLCVSAVKFVALVEIYARKDLVKSEDLVVALYLR